MNIKNKITNAKLNIKQYNSQGSKRKKYKIQDRFESVESMDFKTDNLIPKRSISIYIYIYIYNLSPKQNHRQRMRL